MAPPYLTDPTQMMMMGAGGMPTYTPYSGGMYGYQGQSPYGAGGSTFFPGTTPPGVAPVQIPGLPPMVSSYVGNILPGVLSGMTGGSQVFGQLAFSSGVNYNYYQNWRAQQNQLAYSQVLRDGIQADATRISNLGYGLERTLGLDLTDQQRTEWISGLQGVVNAAAPMLLGSNPRLAEALGLGGMASSAQMYLAGQYDLDPMTGRVGRSASETSDMVAAITGIYERDPQAFRGVTQSRATEFFANARRLGGGVGSVEWRNNQLTEDERDAIIAAGSISDRDLQRMGLTRSEGASIREALTTEDPESRRTAFTEAVEGLDKTRTQDWFRENAETIRALEDVFGRDGSAAELMAQLNQLTQNNEGRLSKAEQASLLREFKALGEMTGATMETITMLSGMAADAVEQGGGPRRLSAGITQEVLSRQVAYRQMGMGEDYNIDELAMWDTQRLASGMTSASANQLGFIQRLKNSGALREDSNLDRILRAASQGRTTYTDTEGNERELYFENIDELMSEAVSATGFRREALYDSFLQNEANWKAAAGNERAIGNQQWVEARRMMEKTTADDLTRTYGSSTEDASRISSTLLDNFEGMSIEQRRSRDFIRESTEARLRELGMSESDAKAYATTWLARVDRDNFIQLADSTQSDALAGDLVRRAREQNVQISEAVSGLSSPDILKNVTDWLQKVGSGEITDPSLSSLLGAGVGGIQADELTRLLGEGPIAEANARIAELSKLGPDAIDPKTGLYRDQALAQIIDTLSETSGLLGGQQPLADESQAILNSLGLGAGTSSEIAQMLQGKRELTDAQAKTARTQLQSAAKDLGVESDSVKHMSKLLGISTEDLLAGNFEGVSNEKLYAAAQSLVAMNIGAQGIQEIYQQQSQAEAAREKTDSTGSPVEADKPPSQVEIKGPVPITGKITIDGRDADFIGNLNPNQGSIA